MATTITGGEHYSIADEGGKPSEHQKRPRGNKNEVRAVHDVASSYGSAGFEHMLPHVLEQSRLTCLWISLNLHARDRDVLIPCLDNGLHTVAKARHDV